MTKDAFLSKWLFGPPLTGWRAALFALLAVAVPTLGRLWVDSLVTGVVFAPYIPFALAAAVLLQPWLAATVAIGSALIADWLFLEPRFSFSVGVTGLVGVAVLLFCSAVTILLVWEVRREFAANRHRIATGEAWTGIVFSSLGGQALASWYNGPSHIPLGPEDEVAEMMEDFLAQVELGKRLNGNASGAELQAPDVETDVSARREAG